MAVELHFKKSDKSPWGFRLAGGADFDVPLTVIKVAPGSIAENAGMQVGDVVVRINETSLSSLIHAEAHDVIVSSGNDFVLAVRRGDLSNLPSKLLLYETSVENGITSKQEISTNQPPHDADLNITDEEIATIIGEHVQSSQKKEHHTTEIAQKVEREEISESVREERREQRTEISLKQSEVAKVILNESQQQIQDKKWSTFLQKPKNPKPKPKPKEVEQPKAPPYRVVIKKQPKKGETPPKENGDVNHVDHDEPEQLETKEEIEENQDSTDYQDNELKEDNESNEEPGKEEPSIEEIPHQEHSEEYKEETEEKQEDVEIELSESQRELSATIEKQLAEVQKQLLALSQLPSTIQQTLNAVTQQLSELVAASHQELSIETNIRIEEEESIEEQTESVEYREQALSVLEEASCEEEEAGQLTFEEVARTESEDEQALFEALEKECEQSEMESQIMTEEELEAHRLEQERLEMKEKENRRGSSSQPLTPLQRPIILPGGRKWSAPNDVESKLRKPSLTDERIAKTISSYSEVISGRTMGLTTGTISGLGVTKKSQSIV